MQVEGDALKAMKNSIKRHCAQNEDGIYALETKPCAGATYWYPGVAVAVLHTLKAAKAAGEVCTWEVAKSRVGKYMADLNCRLRKILAQEEASPEEVIPTEAKWRQKRKKEAAAWRKQWAEWADKHWYPKEWVGKFTLPAGDIEVRTVLNYTALSKLAYARNPLNSPHTSLRPHAVHCKGLHRLYRRRHHRRAPHHRWTHGRA